MTTKSLQYLKIFEVLKNANAPVAVSTIQSLNGIVPTRLSTYLWEIKKNTGFEIKVVRDGRSVVSYELVGSGSMPTVTANVVMPKVAPKKLAKLAKLAKVANVSKPKQEGCEFDASPSKAGVINVLDEINADITDFEDRSFASAYVRGIA